MKGENKMKKILFAIAIVLTLSLSANAQGKKDAFFNDWDNSNNRGIDDDIFPVLMGGELGGLTGNQDAPLGSGLLVLTALGAGYAVARKNRK